MQLHRYKPQELYAKHNAARASISSREFFGPKHQKAREVYCAALFSITYTHGVAPCLVAIEEPDPQNDIDFYLEVQDELFEFQITEVLEPGRRRGDEYKMAQAGSISTQDWQAAHDHGPEWIRDGIAKKLEAYGGAVAKMNLLVYVNFPAYELEYATVRSVAAAMSAPFSSVWLMTGNAISCIKEGEHLGRVEGWLCGPVETAMSPSNSTRQEP